MNRRSTNRFLTPLCVLLAGVIAFTGAAMVKGQDAETRSHLMHDLGGPFIIYRDPGILEQSVTSR